MKSICFIVFGLYFSYTHACSKFFNENLKIEEHDFGDFIQQVESTTNSTIVKISQLDIALDQMYKYLSLEGKFRYQTLSFGNTLKGIYQELGIPVFNCDYMDIFYENSENLAVFKLSFIDEESRLCEQIVSLNKRAEANVFDLLEQHSPAKSFYLKHGHKICTK
ncbi:MAG: hypothetical protein HON90_01690 [Halobacteriovoraceae bacterium]|mgnify:CR=1 FL=1|jgi:hypothetical protein|nr:hypothetical protein [Halobacteriovoraceae bacterium]